MTNFSTARENMVESQVRPNGITDHRIIAAMAEIAREEFVPAERRAVAYVDEDVALTGGSSPRYLIEAMAFAKLVQLAEIKSTDKLLHIGAATGYGTAVLARLAARVVALESDAKLVVAARSNLGGIANITIVEGNLADGVKPDAPFEVIFVEGRVGELPQSLISQAAEGGRIVAVVGEADMARAHVWTITGKNFACRPAFDASVAPLPGFARKKAAFVF
jgi:protein-L-isoaspartate(D-aspartate) O-methyltransferase